MVLSNRVKLLAPSSTIAISSKAKELSQQGHHVINLSVGEPDFNTPEYILEAAKQAMDEGQTKYTPSSGIKELKEAIIDKFRLDHLLVYDKDQIVVTTGAKHALYAFFQAVIDEGDEVIIPAPYWVSYIEQVKLAGGNPVIVHTEETNDFKMTPEQLGAAITNKTKAIIINSPSNPTGMIYSEDELKALGEVCVEHDILIVSDEIYEKLIYSDDQHISIAQISPDFKERTVIINGVSKSHAMTGWRIGYAAGPTQIIRAMTNIISHETSNPTTIAQYAALAAYKQESGQVAVMQQAFAERLEAFYQLIVDIPGITCRKPKGAFYLFPNVINTVKACGFNTVDEWTAALLEEEKVALVPGSAFGAPDFVRLSYATSMDELEEAAIRINRFVNKHQTN